MGICPLARGGGSDATSRQSRRSLKWHAHAKISRRSLCLGLRVRLGVMAAPGRSLAGWSCLGSARVSGSSPRGAGLGLEVLRRGPSACLLSTRSGLGLACSGQVTVEEFTPFYLPRAAPQGQSPTWGASVRVWTFETHKPPISGFAEHSRVFVAEGA